MPSRPIRVFRPAIHNEDYLLNTSDVPILATIPDLNAKTPKKYGYYGASDRKGSAA